ncbi:MAG: AMMECR1 family protein, partial [Bacteroidales bacterium]|nr:AMMECR1 family protein [Bacteroidales bacterium]
QEMTIAAATQDKRFAPVETTELEYIKIELSVMTPLQQISSIDEFQLARHGIYMTRNGHSGTYLPQVAEQTGWSAEDLLGHCAREKAGIGWDGWKEADLYVYEAIIFGEDKKK